MTYPAATGPGGQPPQGKLSLDLFAAAGSTDGRARLSIGHPDGSFLIGVDMEEADLVELAVAARHAATVLTAQRGAHVPGGGDVVSILSARR